MYQDGGTTVVQKRMSFLSALVCSTALVVITIILSLTGITIYGMRLLDRKTDNLTGLIQESVKALPAVREALPPALADAFDDQRQPEYLQNLAISVKMADDQRGQRVGRHRVVVQVQNNGDETVTLLSMRLLELDADGDPVMEWSTWAATPLQLDGEWRGPLLPHETRRFAMWCHSHDQVVKVVHEVSDVRIWFKDGPKMQADPSKQPQKPLPNAST
ncbi:MAG TPA: hypothetical protein VMV94_02165 [Phycisphaerae bacterium]|nr:hypothetical protein [Phycisphaerae bacterium]